MSELNNIAIKILENGKGILAADESTVTMTKRLESVKIPSTPENRLLFRETLFSASGMTECIGGVILYDETIRQESSKKNKIPELISNMGSMPGIKVDIGAKVLAGSENEKITEGLDGLRERLKEYYKLGAKFTKWRGVYNISENYPSKLSIHSNAHALARYSALVQECNMVPIVEPEVLMDGEHSAKDCYQKTSEVIKKCFDELILHKIDLKGIILKPNMIISGAAVTDRKLSEFAAENNLSGFEFLSCIPGTIGGGIKMNAGCFGNEIKDIIVSVQAIDILGNIFTIPSSKINFNYRSNDLSEDLIFLSASFKGKKKDAKIILKTMAKFKEQKDNNQPTKIKTSGSTFKNPIKDTNKKVWELIKESVPSDIRFGDACISDKHSNFFVNKGNATFKDMKKLINYVEKSVFNKTGINIEKEIKILEN
mgnify:CR=1 FL=1